MNNSSFEMTHQILKSLAIYCLFLLFSVSCTDTEERQLNTAEFLQMHIEWFSADERSGRLSGTLQEAESANYIADLFLQFGLTPAGDDLTYMQHFTLSGPVAQSLEVDNHIARNVAGMIEGVENPDQFIIVGAHYDSQGNGGVISMNENNEPSIHNGADDNASGTVGMVHLAKKFSENPPQKSILFIAFSGEEQGLQGARYFAENMEFEKDSVLAMINMDMIGRMEENKLTIFGTGTSDIWENLLAEVEHDSLEITQTPGGSGASDHAAFYEKGIPVLHYFTGTHEDYHRESDTADKINYDGMERVLSHVEEVVNLLQNYSPDEITFTESTDARGSVMSESSVTLGVLPDYSYSGLGFRIEGIRDGRPADQAGMREGDLIIRMGEIEIGDIYDYMESLSEFESGEEVDILILRENEEMTVTVTF